jgi:DNA repair protein RecN (Recombination protein N)
MLISLHIKNYALIDDIRLEFKDGLNIFSGETGAGKSIIIESLGLILGERASSQNIKKDAKRCFITGEFDISKMKDLKTRLSDSGLNNDDMLILRREVDINGKSRAFANDIPVSLNTLSNIGEYLVDVHGQHEHQTLIKSSSQRRLLDLFGGCSEIKAEISRKYHEWKELINQKESQNMSEEERQKQLDLYGFQLKEIDGADLQPGEEEEMENILPQLKNAEKLRDIGQRAYEILNGMDGSVLENINKVQRLLENINSICAGMGETSNSVTNACYQLEEAAKDIQNFYENLESDPEKLNNYLVRQDLFSKLKKKYGRSLAEVLEYRDKIANKLSLLSKSSENKQELENKIKQSYSSLLELCKKLTLLRKKAGEKLSAATENELKDLGMKKAHFKTAVEQLPEPTSEGMDKVEFLFCANPGENLNPLRDIASGGEMSRVMLALKTVFAKSDMIPVMVFDEIDAGIGGPMGQVVGKKMKNLSKYRQILCITHLPQIAAFADQHMSVTKTTEKGKTSTHVEALSDKEHTEEIARMLSGEKITPSARKHAEELVKQSL